MRNTARKDVLRLIKSTKMFFITMIVVSALAVMMYTGVSFATDSLKNSCEEYYDKNHFYDLQMLCVYGFDDSKVHTIMENKQVDQFETCYYTQELIAIQDNEYVADIYTHTGDVNRPFIQQGRIPTSPEECMVEDALLDRFNLKIGDTITMPDPSSMIKEKSFTIVGSADLVTVFSTNDFYNRGTSELGDGQVTTKIMVTEDAFSDDAVQRLCYITIKDRAERGSDAYIQQVTDLKDQLVPQLLELDKQTFQEKKNRLSAELADGQSEYASAETEIKDASKALTDATDSLAEAKENLKQNKQKLSDGKSQLEDAATQIESAESQLASARSQLDSSATQLASAKAQLDQGAIQLSEMRSMLDSKSAELAAAKAELDAGAASLDDAKTQLDTADSQLNEAKVRLDEAQVQIEQYQTQLDQLNSQISELKAILGEKRNPIEILLILEKIRTLQVQADQISSGLEEGRAEYDAQYAIYESQKAEYDSQFAQYTSKKAEYDSSYAEYERACAQLESGESSYTLAVEEYQSKNSEYNSQKTTYEAAEAEYSSNVKLLEEKKAAYEAALREYEDSQEKIRQGENNISESQNQIETNTKELNTQKEKLKDAQKELDEAAESLDMLPEGKVYAADINSNASYVYYKQTYEGTDTVATTLSILLLAIATLVCYTTISRLVTEQHRLIGAQKAFGFRTREIYGKYIAYVAIAVLIGCVLGLICSYTFMQRTVYYLSYRKAFILKDFTPEIKWSSAIILTLLEVLIMSFSAFFACRQMLKKSAIDLLNSNIRSEHRGKGKDKTFLPLSILMSVRNLKSNPQILLTAVVSVLGCTFLLITVLHVQHGMAGISEHQFSVLQNYQGTITINKDRDQESIDALRTYIDNNSQISALPVSEKMVSYQGDGQVEYATMICLDEATDPSDFVRFIDPETNDLMPIPEEGIYVCSKLAERNSLQPGDYLLVTDTDGSEYNMKISGIFDRNIGMALVISDAYYESFLKEPIEFTQYYVAGEESQVEAFVNRAKTYPAYSSWADSKYYENEMEFKVSCVNQVILVMLIIICILSLFVLSNLSAMNIKKKEKEIVTMKVLGFPKKRIYTYIFRESMMMCLIGLALGMLLGSTLGAEMIKLVELQNLKNIRGFSLSACLIGAGVNFIFFTLSNLLALKGIKKIKMTGSAREA